MTALPRPTPRSAPIRGALGATAVAFGVATLIEGGRVLFGGPAARAEAGDVVPFVLVFNFSVGFVYALVGVATILGRRWATWGARALALASLAVFATFGLHVLGGGAYETRTVIAMIVRSGFWVAQSILLPNLPAVGSTLNPRAERASSKR